MTKIKKAREILEHGDKILITIFFRGREMAHKENGRRMMVKIKAELADFSKVEHDVRMEGPRMQITLLPKPGVKPKPKAEAAPEVPAPAAPVDPAPAASVEPSPTPQGETNAQA